MKYDVIVIGAGLGGLECACLLSQAGRSVLVLEKEHQTGGCLQSYRRRGLDYDTGFHYVGGLGEGQSLHDAFARLGKGIPAFIKVRKGIRGLTFLIVSLF